MTTLKGWKRTAAQGEQTSADGKYKAVRNAYGEWHLYAIERCAGFGVFGMASTEYINTYSTLAAAKLAAHTA
tara:strand:- start:223 stop:438 length:216 start_codon:yes stop_codon:yes gene_type:complete